MSKRQFSMYAYWNHLNEKHTPIMSFRHSGMPFDEWQAKARAKLFELLGEFPEKVPLDAEIELVEEHEKYVRKRVVFDTEEFMSVPCNVLIPKSANKDRKTPAILCSHGHGSFGKDPVSGVVLNEHCQNDIDEMNYNYAEQMAEFGFVTLAPDLRSFGERKDGMNPFPGRDACNVNFIKGAMFGTYPFTLNIWDMMRCIDYLETMDEVDPDRIGMMGLSQGGTMTTFVTALEPRIKAADIMGYVNPFGDFAIDRANFCGSQMVPGLYKYFDTFDIAGLIAPRPLLIEMGVYDTCFPVEHLKKGYEGAEYIYKTSGFGDMIDADIHPGGHAFSGDKAFGFFKKYLMDRG